MIFKEYYFNESINDKNLFKVVFLAGGPGSGKSFISDLAFKGEPVSFVNQDAFTEMIFKRDDIPFVFDTKNQEIYARQAKARERAKELTSKRLLVQVDGMLSLVIDGTGRHYPKIDAMFKAFKNIGYDPYMVFVNTTLDVAKERNKKRKRKVEDKFLVDAWHSVQDNIGKFQSLFGAENFVIIDNSKVLDDKEIKDLELKLTRQSRKFLNEPLKNPIGKIILKKLHQKGGKNISDISKTLEKNPGRFSV